MSDSEAGDDKAVESHPDHTPHSGEVCAGSGLDGGQSRVPARSPLLRSVSEGVVSVALVGCLVVADAVGQAVPEDLPPAVDQGAQSGVVVFARSDFLVVEFTGLVLWVRLRKAHQRNSART